MKCDLVEKGYMVLSPETEHAPFDVVAYHNGVFSRIQVKYRSAKDGKLKLNFSSAWADQYGNHTVLVDKSAIDQYAIYCPETDKCYYFNPLEFRASVTLRVEPSANNQKIGINMASDYDSFKLG